jgi:hypothetical protein
MIGIFELCLIAIGWSADKEASIMPRPYKALLHVLALIHHLP